MSTAKVKAAAAPQAAPLAANDGARQIEQAVAAGTETIDTVVRISKEAAAKAQTAALRSYEDVVGSTRENVDALVQAGTILTRGFQDIGKALFALAQGSIEDSVAASRQMMAAKTLREVVDLQAALSKQSLDRLMGEGTRLSDLSLKLAEEAFAPLTERVNATVDKLVKTAA